MKEAGCFRRANSFSPLMSNAIDYSNQQHNGLPDFGMNVQSRISFGEKDDEYSSIFSKSQSHASQNQSGS